MHIYVYICNTNYCMSHRLLGQNQCRNYLGFEIYFSNLYILFYGCLFIVYTKFSRFWRLKVQEHDVGKILSWTFHTPEL